MRIYFYNHYLYGRGGMETVVPMVCKYLMKRGHDVKIILMKKSEYTDWTLGIPVIYLEAEVESKQNRYADANETYGRIMMLQEGLRRLPAPDVIVPMDIENIIPARIASEVYIDRPKIISWIHLSLKVLKNQKNLIFADAHLSINKENMLELRKLDEYGPTYLVYNPVSMQTDVISRPTIPNFIFLGRLGHQKRLDRVLHALANVSGDWTLQVIGDGDKGPGYKKLAKELGIDDRITWEGWKIRPWEVIKKASAMLLSSDFEGFPVCIIESHAHGIPVIAGDCPSGPAEMIQNGINGWLYPYRDVVALSSILNGVVQKEILLPSQETVKQTALDYDVEKVVNRIEKALLDQCNWSEKMQI